MNYVLDYVVNHLGNRHSGTVVLRREGPPKAGDDLEVRIAGFSTPILIDSVDSRKEIYGIQHARLVCSTYTL